MELRLRFVFSMLFFAWFSTMTFSQDSLRTPMDSDARIALQASVEQTEVPLNRDVRFTVTLQWSGDLDCFEVHSFDNPLFENLKIQGSGSANRVTSVNGVTTAIREYSYTLQPESMGMAYIEPFIIIYTDVVTDTEHRLTTQRIPVEIVDPVAETRSTTWWWLAIPLLVAAIIFGVLRRSPFRKSQQESKAETVTVPLEEVYLQELHEEIDLNDPTQDGVKTYSQISRLLRRFMHEKFNAPGFEATSGEIYQVLYDQKFSDAFINQVKEILSTADVIKFSGRAVDRSEVERAYTQVESMFEQSLNQDIKFQGRDESVSENP